MTDHIPIPAKTTVVTIAIKNNKDIVITLSERLGDIHANYEFMGIIPVRNFGPDGPGNTQLHIDLTNQSVAHIVQPLLGRVPTARILEVLNSGNEGVIECEVRPHLYDNLVGILVGEYQDLVDPNPPSAT